jgi:N-methylhydantoinase B
MTPGGGGYGDPALRDPGQVERDLRRGYYGRAEAERLFHVRVAADGTVDRAATADFRARRLEGG